MAPFLGKALGVSALAGMLACGGGSAQDPASVTVTGRIECDETPIASKTPGRVISMEVREGDQVAEGQTLIRLSGEQQSARRDQAVAQLSAAEQELARARLRLPVIEENLRQISLRVDQARRQSEGTVATASGALAAAQAELARAESEDRQARADAERFEKLASKSAVPKQVAEQYRTKAQATASLVEAAREHVAAARGGLEAASAGSANPSILESERIALERQRDEARGVIAIAEAGVEAAQALVEQAEADVSELEIRSPISGFVVTRSAEPGQVIAPGLTLLTLASQQSMFFRGFVAAGELDQVQVGAPADVELDAIEGSLPAEVTRVDPEATFTPESVYFADERTRQAVGVKLRLKTADSRVKLGMTGEASLR